ncbi:homeobox protein VENTX [Pteropus medius]|uniref:homeobox protein VENTX n=1 Tax=Pteropus vampyrus TaxID=132908 RepID=UPI00196B7A49|nr:homeobox protein VENTX [Pteropus giganteus]
MNSVSVRPPPGFSKGAHNPRPPRMRTAFAAEQLSTLESSFQHRRYLGPLERRTLAQKVRMSEVQIKTWFQNRRMKRKRQLQHAPELCAPGFPSPPSALGSGLQLLHPWASLPGPWALAQPPGSFWDPCQVEQFPPARVAKLGQAAASRSVSTQCLVSPDAQGPRAVAAMALPSSLQHCQLPWRQAPTATAGRTPLVSPRPLAPATPLVSAHVHPESVSTDFPGCSPQDGGSRPHLTERLPSAPVPPEGAPAAAGPSPERCGLAGRVLRDNVLASTGLEPRGL